MGLKWLRGKMLRADFPWFFLMLSLYCTVLQFLGSAVLCGAFGAGWGGSMLLRCARELISCGLASAAIGFGGYICGRKMLR